MSRIITAVVVTISTLGMSVVTATASSAAGDQVSTRLQRAVAHLPLARETRAGYDRDKFLHWVDANSNCQDTRDEVLAAESRVDVSGCDVQAGEWRSYYDGVTTTDSTAFDIDHLVALAEAWDSGAKRWNADTRKRYANDLGDRRSLVAVTASSNRSKSDRDVAEWLPQFGRCRYVREWVAVKIRWGLKVDRSEKRALRSLADDCPNSRIQITRATIHIASEGGGGATGGGGGGGDGLDPRFDYCYQAIEAGYGPYYQRGRTPSTTGTQTATTTASFASERQIRLHLDRRTLPARRFQTWKPRHLEVGIGACLRRGVTQVRVVRLRACRRCR